MKGNNKSNSASKDALAPNNRIIVQNLDYDTTEEILVEYFSQFGKVLETEIPMNPKIQRSKGFGFVTFSTVEEATKAVSKEGHEIDERTVRANYAKLREKGFSPENLEKGKKLYIGKLPWAINQEELKEYFEKFGPVEDAFLPTVSKYASLVNGYPVHKGFGFVTFANEEDANKAVLVKNHLFKSEPISVRKAKPQEESRSPKEAHTGSGDDKKPVVVKRKGKHSGGENRKQERGERNKDRPKKEEKSRDEKQEKSTKEEKTTHSPKTAPVEEKAAETVTETKTETPPPASENKPKKTAKKKEPSKSAQPPVVVSTKAPAENPWSKKGSSADSSETTKDFPTLAKKKRQSPKDEGKGKEEKGKDEKQAN